MRSGKNRKSNCSNGTTHHRAQPDTVVTCTERWEALMGAGSPRGPVARVRMFRERHRASIARLVAVGMRLPRVARGGRSTVVSTR